MFHISTGRNSVLFTHNALLLFQAIELIRSCPRGEIQLTFDPAQKSANQEPEKMQQANSVSNGKPESLPSPTAGECIMTGGHYGR